MVPERDSSLYDCFPNSQSQLFRPLIPAISVPNLSSVRCNSNSSSNEADEESSLSSMNSNQIIPTEENGIGIYMTPSLSLSSTNMSTFKTTINPLPSKPSEVKRRSNNRKQIYAALQSNNNPTKIIENENNSIPPPPPFPTNFDSIHKTEQKTVSPPPPPIKVEPINDFQLQIEQAKIRLKKIDTQKSHEMTKPMRQNPSSNYHPPDLKNIIIEELTPSNGFPPPPSPSTLRRSVTATTSLSSMQKPSVIDPRLDTNFSSVIAQRAAAAKARRYENPIGFDNTLNRYPPSTTFFNNCITTNGIQLSSKLYT
jgi:hypothetical protein